MVVIVVVSEQLLSRFSGLLPQSIHLQQCRKSSEGKLVGVELSGWFEKKGKEASNQMPGSCVFMIFQVGKFFR